MALIPKPTQTQQSWILSKIPQTFVLRILNPQELLFVGKVHALSSANYKGNFDILPGHANIISIIYRKVELFGETDQKQVFEFDVGILRFINNSADLYLGLEFSQVLDQVAADQGQDLRREILSAQAAG